MTTNTEIHGIPQPPLGYRLAFKNETFQSGSRYWMPGSGEWGDVGDYLTGKKPIDSYIYAIPLDDGYEYFEAGETTAQAGDEVDFYGTWEPFGPYAIGRQNGDRLRRPKAKPLTFAEQQLSCGLKAGDRVRCTREPNKDEIAKSGWISEMIRLVGQLGTVVSIGREGVDVQFDDESYKHWGLPCSVLEKVSKKTVPLEAEDWKGIWWIENSIKNGRLLVVEVYNDGVIATSSGLFEPQGLMRMQLKRSQDGVTWTPCSKEVEA